MKGTIGGKVQKFYNETPFPDYELERFENKEQLRILAYPFAETLDRSIPKDASIIDVGTGTGQLSAFLSLKRKNVWGIDFSDSSLKKANALKEKLKLDTLTLKKVNILNDNEIEKLPKFDYVLCMGVLHHTGNPKKAFRNILKLLKPNGKIAIGLYNKYGRIPLKIRIFLAKTIFRNNQKVKDYFIRLQIGEIKDKERARGWWNDQYEHPHESTHTIGEVLDWFKKYNVKYLQTVPNTKFSNGTDLECYGLFNKERKPTIVHRAYNQLKWIYTTHKEGGYWITFGRLK